MKPAYKVSKERLKALVDIDYISSTQVPPGPWGILGRGFSHMLGHTITAKPDKLKVEGKWRARGSNNRGRLRN